MAQAIYLTRWIDDDCWEAMVDDPRDFLDYESVSCPQVYGVHTDEAVATAFGKGGLIAELRSTFDYEDQSEDDLESLERIDAATWTDGEWTALPYHPGCEQRIFTLNDDEGEQMGTVVIQRRYADTPQ